MTVEALQIEVTPSSKAAITGLLDSLNALEASLKRTGSAFNILQAQTDNSAIETASSFRRSAEGVSASMKAMVNGVSFSYKIAAKDAIDNINEIAKVTAKSAEFTKALNAQQLANTEKMLQTEVAARADAYAKQRVLNTNFLASSLASQIAFAEKAKIFTSLGGDATTKFGSAAASADIAALTARHNALQPVLRNTTSLQSLQNGVLGEAQGLFRGAAHEAGLYGLVHGQLIAILAGGALAAAIHHIAVTGAEVEYSLQFLRSLSTDLRPIDMDKFIGISSGTLSNLKQAAEGMRSLAEAGFSQSQAMAALPDVLRLSALGEMSVAQAAELAVEAMHAFGKASTDLGEIGDILVTVASKSNISVHKLAEDMKSASVTGELFGLTMKETAATVGTLAERGLTIQPLSSALQKLYEPSAKAQAELNRLNLTTKDDQGNLRKYTDLIGDLAGRLNQFKVPADEMGRLGFSSRDIKAVEAMTQHYEDYLHILKATDESGGKMFQATLQQEDTVEGSFKRLASTVDSTLAKAFEQASPIIRTVEEQLLNFSKSQGVVDFFSGLAVSVARLAQVLVDHAALIRNTVAAYVALRLVIGVSGMVVSITEFIVAQEAAMLAANATAGAVQRESSSLIILSAETKAAALGTEVLSAGSAAAGISLTTAATGARLFTSALGWIGVALAAVTVAYELFHNSVTEDEAKRAKALNSANTSIDAYEREITRLKELEKQLTLTGEAGVTAALKVATADLRIQRAKDASRISQLDKVEFVAQFEGKSEFDRRREKISLLSDIAGIDKLIATQENAVTELAATDTRVKKLQEEASLKEKIGKLSDLAKGVSSSKASEIASEIAALKSENITHENYTETLKKEVALELEIKAAKKDVVKTDKAGANDTFKSQIAALQGQIEKANAEAKSADAAFAAMYKTGKISALEYFADVRDATVKKLTTDKALFAQEEELNARQEHRKADIQKISNKIAADDRGIVEANLTYSQKVEEAVHASEVKTTQFKVEEMKKRGDTVNAYTLENAEKIKALNLNLETAYASLNDALDKNDSKKLASSLAAVSQFETERTQIDLTIAQYVKLKEVKDAVDEINRGLSSATDSGTLSSAYQVSTLAGSKLKQYGGQLATAQQSGDPSVVDEALKNVQKFADLNTKAATTAATAWKKAGTDIADSLTKSFGKAGIAAGGVFKSYTDAQGNQKVIDAQYANEREKHPEDLAKLTKKYNSDTAINTVDSYAQMLGAAKGYFNEHSAGYRIMAGIEKAMYLVKFALQAQALVLDATGTAASVANSATRATADGAAAIAKCFATLGPIGGAIAAAAVVAVLVAAGVQMFGGNVNTNIAQDRQASAGTGSILGDATAKSDSIAKSIADLKTNSDMSLPLSQGMLTSLRNIESGIGGLGNLVSQSMNTTGALPGSKFAPDTALARGFGSLHTQGDPVLHNILKLFGTSKSLVDQGITVGSGQTLSSIMSNGLNASAYQDVETKKKFIFTYSDKITRETSALGSELSNQFTMIINNLGTSTKFATAALGVDGAEFDKNLKNFVVNIPDISFKDMTGDQIQKQFEAIFSKLGDDIAKAAMPSLTAFQKVGEGYFQTLLRVANGVESAKHSLDKFGIAIINYTDIVNKQGDVGAELVRQSIDVFETLKSGTLTGVGEIIRTLDGSASDLISAYQTLVDLRKLMKSAGLNPQQLGSSLIKGAGSAADLKTGLSTYNDKFFTDPEKLAAQLSDLHDSFSKLGLSVPDSEAAYKDLVKSTGTSTEATSELTGKILALAGAFSTASDLAKTIADKTIADAKKSADDQAALDLQLMQAGGKTAAYTASVRKNVLASLTGMLRDTQAAIYKAEDIVSARATVQQAYDAEATPLKDTVTQFKAFSKAVKDFSASLLLGSSTTLGVVSQTTEAKKQFQQAQTNSKSLDKLISADGFGKLQNSAQQLLAAAKVSSVSQLDYKRTFAQVSNALDDSANFADQQIDVAQKSLDMLDLSVKGIVDVKNATLSVRDAIVAYFKVGGTKTVEGGGSGTVNPKGDATYSDVAASASKYGGDSYYFIPGVNDYEAKLDSVKGLQKLLGGTIEDDFVQFTGHSQLYWMNAQTMFDTGQHPTTLSVPGFAAGGDFFGGLRRVGENGPELEATGAARYWSASKTAQMMSGSGQADTAQMSEVNDRLDKMQQTLELYLYQLVKHALNTADTADKWDKQGMPPVRST